MVSKNLTRTYVHIFMPICQSLLLEKQRKGYTGVHSPSLPIFLLSFVSPFPFFFHPLHLVCFIHPLSPPLRLIRFSSLCDIFFKAVSGFQLSSLMQEHHRYFSVKSTSGTMQEISLRLMVEGSKCLGTNSEMWVILKSRVRGQKS